MLISMGAGAAESAFALGNMARRNVGTPWELKRARAFYHFAADKGHARAMHALANMHALGLGGARELAKAYFWYWLAADRGHEAAAQARDVVAELLPYNLRRKTRVRAERWQPAKHR